MIKPTQTDLQLAKHTLNTRQYQHCPSTYNNMGTTIVQSEMDHDPAKASRVMRVYMWEEGLTLDPVQEVT